MLGVVFLTILFRVAWVRLLKAADPMDLALHMGAFAACCGLLVHSFVDFNLHIPSNALLFLLQAALATSPTTPSVSPERLRRTVVKSAAIRRAESSLV